MSKFAHVLKLYKNKLSLEVGAETWLEVLSWVSVALLVCQSPDFQETGLPQICFPPKSYFITPSSLFYRCSVGEITLDEQKRKTSGKTLLTKSAICHGADNFITGLTVTLGSGARGRDVARMVKSVRSFHAMDSRQDVQPIFGFSPRFSFNHKIGWIYLIWFIFQIFKYHNANGTWKRFDECF